MIDPDFGFPIQDDRVENYLSDDNVKTYLPQCDDKLKPRIGQSFLSLEDGIKFYKNYALACGFDIRLGTTSRAADGTLVWKYILCNREGEKQVGDVVSGMDTEDSNSKRRRVSRRFNCMARIALRYTASVGYVIRKFTEEHSHALVNDAYKHFMKINRNLDSSHQDFILSCARANIGPVRSFRLIKEIVGGYSRVGCNVTEFKNFSRDLHAFGHGKDAQMLLDRLFQKRELFPDFYFEYQVDEKEKLKRLFWADTMSRRNYHLFGDVIAFDATYEMNKYNMIFAPFTGKDNHGKLVTFGAGLLSNEDVESYSWIFDRFLSCMKKAPTMLVTDQDPAMKIAIEQIFPGTRHRLCMWHIMRKVKDKVPKHLKYDEAFYKSMNDNVWSSMIEPEEFESRWSEFIISFGLSNNTWFSSMYGIRQSWIPAYFRDFPLSGILRTTSICESANSFFGKYLDKHDDLVEFFMHFESAMDSQRHTYDKNVHEDHSKFPEMVTELEIEKHAASILTNSIFNEVQMSIHKACYKSQISRMLPKDKKVVYTIGGFDVMYDSEDQSIACGCKKFVRIGLICSHMFVVFQNMGINKVPDQYILSRWSKNALMAPNTYFSELSSDSTTLESNHIYMNHIYSEVRSISGLVQGKQSKISAFYDNLRKFKNELLNEGEEPSTVRDKEQVFQDFYGTSIPEEVSVLSPDPVKTKGSGSDFISRREKAIRMMNKQLRRCSKCNQLARHDARNCPEKKES